MVPNYVYSFSHCGCPNFPDDLVKADGTHMVEIITANHFWGQLDQLVPKPAGARSMCPYILHVVKDEPSNSRVPCAEHTGCCFRWARR